jgi:hypothetical protein
MKGIKKVFLAIACLALAALACQAVPRLLGPKVSGTNEAPATNMPAQGNVILEDDFSSATWGTGTDTDSSVEYADQALQMIVYTKNYFVWSTPNATDYDKTHIEVTVKNNNTDPTTTFGIICDKQSGTSDFYYLGITPNGEYAIVKATTGQDDVVLTNGKQWQKSALIQTNASSYRLGADCGNGTLTLYVDGQKIDSIAASDYPKGGVALFTWSGQEATTTNVSFDDFVMRELK